MHKVIKGNLSKLTSEEFKTIMKKSINYSDALRKIGMKVTNPGNFKTLKKRILLESVDITHYEKTRYKNIKTPSSGNTIPLKKILVENSTYTNNSNLKYRLLKKGLLIEKCLKCGLGNLWNGEKIVLQLDHINGKNSDNRLINLRLLCPNCHSQTITFSGRNVSCKKIVILNKEKEKRLCKTDSCKKEIQRRNKSGLCLICYKKYEEIKKRLVERPSKEVLIEKILNVPFLKIAEEYKFSDNAIRKWCKRYNLPYTRKGIEIYKNNINKN